MKKYVSIAMILMLFMSTMIYASNLNTVHSQLATLTPGVPATITQTLDVNIVFVGIPPAWINDATFDAWMLQHYTTVVRSRLWYTLDGVNPIVEPLGLEFDFNYHKIYADSIDSQFTSDLFTYIHANSEEYGQGPPYNTGAEVDVTLRQQSYNSLTATERAGFNITGPNHMTEAQLVESWLETNAMSRLGVDSVNEYTVFFLNGLDNYFAHTYWYIDEPDPDTGAVFGYYGSRVLTAWGGQYGRSWFLDLSAGPDKFLFKTLYPAASTYSSAVRPIWEFNVAGGYRTDLSKRLAFITRFVAVDMLFTPSPLYPPYLQPPLLPDKILIDTNMFEHSADLSGASIYTPGLTEQVYEDLQPYIDYTETFEDYQLSDYPVLKKAFENWAAYNEKSIFGKKSPYWQYAYAGIDFHLYFTEQLFRFLKTQEMQQSQAEYAVRIFGFTIDDDYMGYQWGLGGRADDNWVDGTQECTYTFNTPYWTYNVGYGATLTLIHETGHHLGLSHPHDGEDPVYGEVYYLGQFIWVGDNSYTVMHYHDLTYNMGVFNKDSMNRYMTITYLNYANKILKMIEETPHAGDVDSMVAYADAKATEALGDYQNMDYLNAVTKMKLAYDTIVEASMLLHIPVEPYDWHSDYKARSVTLFDPLIDP